MALTDCPWCDSTHGDMLLCEAAKRILDGMAARARELDMPTIEFDQPMPGSAAMFGPDTVLVAQLVVKAATVDVAGQHRPVLIFTGLDSERRTLPQWVYPGRPQDIQAAVKLVRDTAGMAIRTAHKHNPKRGNDRGT